MYIRSLLHPPIFPLLALEAAACGVLVLSFPAKPVLRKGLMYFIHIEVTDMILYV